MRREIRIIVSAAIILISICVPLLWIVSVAPDSQADSPHEILNRFPHIDLPQKGHPKLESVLWQLLAMEKAGNAAAFARQNMIDLTDGKVRVIIEAAPGETPEATEAALALRAEVEATYKDLVQAVVQVSALNALADNPSIHLVRLPWKSVAATVSEGASLINSDAWNSAGWTGSGVKVAILDGGFSGYDALLGTELPSSVTTHWAPSIGGPGTSSHGTACAEIVYDIAPDADYYLANFGTGVEMGNAVDWLIAQGVDVISFSMGVVLGGPGDGTGPICDMVDQARAAGILWCNSAGNYAQRHWMGGWVDTIGDDWHEFNPGIDETNAIIASAGYPIDIALKWDDPFGASDNDYDLLLLDASLNLVEWSINDQTGPYDYPVESIAIYAPYTGIYHIVIAMWEADGTANFHLLTPYHDLQYQVASNSLIEPADSASAMTLGAVHWNHPGDLEPFSSQGPTEDNRLKPDLVAPDGMSTATYGPSDGLAYADGGSGFFGTSASAPHAAGAGVLVKEAYPLYSPAQMQAFLEERAIDLGAAGKDNLFGSGRLALGEAPMLFSVTFDAGPDVVSLTIDGTAYSPEELPIQFSWIEGSEHTCVAPSPVASGDEGTQYAFTSWSPDEDTSPSRTITVSANATYTANYKTQHYLTVESDYGDPEGAGWYDEGTTAEVETDETVGDDGTRYIFLNWVVDGDDETDNSIFITMDAPHTAVTAYKTQHFLTVESDYGDPEGEDWYDEGTSAEVETDDIITDDNTRYVFLNWVVDGDDETDNPASVTIDAPYTAVTDYNTQHYLTVNSEYGDPEGQRWYDEGDAATASVTSPVGTIVRKVFTEWSGDSTATTPSATILMDEPKTITAEWRDDYLYLYIIIVGIVVVVGGGSALVISQRRAKKPRRYGGTF